MMKTVLYSELTKGAFFKRDGENFLYQVTDNFDAYCISTAELISVCDDEEVIWHTIDSVCGEFYSIDFSEEVETVGTVKCDVCGERFPFISPCNDHKYNVCTSCCEAMSCEECKEKLMARSEKCEKD